MSLYLIGNFTKEAYEAVDMQTHLFIHTSIILQFLLMSATRIIHWASTIRFVDVIRGQQIAGEREVNIRKCS
jgi:hypothetical protein